MAMHPADLTEHQRGYWYDGFILLDTLIHKGYTDEQKSFYIQGLKARLEEMDWERLHPKMVGDKRHDV